MSFPGRVRAVLFDMDGVLLDSFEAWWQTARDACRRFGTPEVGRETFRRLFGAGSGTDNETFLQGAPLEEIDPHYQRAFPRYAHLVQVEPEAAGVLSSLRGRGIRTACITNSTRDLARLLLESQGLAPLLDAVLTPEDAGAAKPAPDLVLRALGDLGGFPPAESLVAGDSVYDLGAARAAGAPFVGLRLDGGDFRIERLEEILRIVVI